MMAERVLSPLPVQLSHLVVDLFCRETLLIDNYIFFGPLIFKGILPTFHLIANLFFFVSNFINKNVFNIFR